MLDLTLMIPTVYPRACPPKLLPLVSGFGVILKLWPSFLASRTIGECHRCRWLRPATTEIDEALQTFQMNLLRNKNIEMILKDYFSLNCDNLMELFVNVQL